MTGRWFPSLQEILRINPTVKIIASPWSAPPWMKSNGSYVAGRLKPESYSAYARYFVKYIETMRGAWHPCQRGDAPE